MPRRIRYDVWSPGAGSPWTTPWCEPGFAFTELVASWEATTPRGTWIEVAVQAGGTRSWHELGRWASGAHASHRTSVSGDAQVDTDIWKPAADTRSYRLRIVLHATRHQTARVHSLAAVVTAGPVRRSTSPPLTSRARVLDVPRLSQMTWTEVGGAGWCSPTSVAMVLAHAGTLPPDTDIPRAAAEVVDPAYGDGTGNWPFNTAWAAGLAGHAFVTRLHDLRDAERFVDAGIPLVASVAYPAGALGRAPTHGTDGHLVVIRGFTPAGDVVTNDPGAPTDRSVRRTYDRGELERAWLGGSGGLVYVIHRDDQTLPSGSRGAW